MATIYVGIGELAASNSPDDVIKTMALGSCVAVIASTRDRRTAGLIHIALPDSSINKKMAQEQPGMFADTGIPLLIQTMIRKSGVSGGGFLIKLAGGASIMDPNNTFNIGKRNILAVKKILWANHLGAIAEDVGDNISRTVTLDVGHGRVILSSPGRGEWEL